MATNWLITDIVSHSNYASGLFLGEHWVVRDSIFHSNGVTGIGGDVFAIGEHHDAGLSGHQLSHRGRERMHGIGQGR